MPRYGWPCLLPGRLPPLPARRRRPLRPSGGAGGSRAAGPQATAKAPPVTVDWPALLPDVARLLLADHPCRELGGDKANGAGAA